MALIVVSRSLPLSNINTDISVARGHARRLDSSSTGSPGQYFSRSLAPQVDYWSVPASATLPASAEHLLAGQMCARFGLVRLRTVNRRDFEVKVKVEDTWQWCFFMREPRRRTAQVWLALSGVTEFYLHTYAFIYERNKPPVFAFPAEAGPHLPTSEGWKAELA